MRFNPCGRLVDWRRVPFRSKVRPFRNDDREVGIVWYPVAKGAPALGRVSCIAVPDWDDVYWEWSGNVGEYTADRVHANERPRVIAKYDHVCGTDEDFEQGGEYDADLPPVTYGANGLPTCCNPTVVGVGGVVVGGSGLVGYIPRPGAYGGLAVGGGGVVGYLPAGPPGGPSCALAASTSVPVSITDTITAGAASWWTFTADGTHDYLVTDPTRDETTLSVSARSGSCPPTGGVISVIHFLGEHTWLLSPVPAGAVFLALTGHITTAVDTFTITEV